MSEHVQQEKKLPIADARQAWLETAGSSAFVFSTYLFLIPFPIFAIGRIGNQIIKCLPHYFRFLFGKRTAINDIVGITTTRIFHE